MKSNRAQYAVSLMCQVLGVSPSGYYARALRKPSARSPSDASLTQRIKKIHEESRGTYGVPRTHFDLAEPGVRVGRKRVARLMKAAGLQGVSRRKWVRTTVRCPGASPAPDLVDRDFSAPGPDRVWVADITDIPTWVGFLYLAVVLDVWSRRVVGWALATHLKTRLVLDALNMAIWQRRPTKVVHHSDHGTQYTLRTRWTSPKSASFVVSVPEIIRNISCRRPAPHPLRFPLPPGAPLCSRSLGVSFAGP